VDERVGDTHGSAELGWNNARAVMDGSGTVFKFARNAGWTCRPKSGGGMVKGVVLEAVTLGQYPKAQFGVLDDELANSKEGGLHLMLAQNIEDLRGLAWIGAIINGEPYFATVCGEGVEDGTVPARVFKQGGG
jgi:hypothetical protein